MEVWFEVDLLLSYCLLSDAHTATGCCLTYAGDEVVLQVQDPQVPAPSVNVFDFLDVLLVQRNLLQGEDLTVIVLSSAADHVLCDWTDKTETVKNSAGNQFWMI